MFNEEITKAINNLQERTEFLERQTKELAQAQKNILLHLREVVMVVAEVSEESSEE